MLYSDRTDNSLTLLYCLIYREVVEVKARKRTKAAFDRAIAPSSLPVSPR
ncbi:MAG: hypothetical protein SW833_15535 [Cyanobacteriota bacterium]|nr:hypothetical protein [Cyanobacteriota bacterium]